MQPDRPPHARGRICGRGQYVRLARDRL
jgi:hypothetical protein